MKKRTIVILSIISALFSLVYVILMHFGLLRYVCLHIYSVDSYTKNYSKLEKASDKEKVVISLTTTPKNKNRIKPIINSLLDQTVKVNEIAISVPYGKEYDIPDEYKDIIQTYRYSVNYGDAAKLIPVVLREEEAETYIIVVNDETVYGKDFIETLIDESIKNPNEAILSGNNAILVKPLFFDENMSKYDGKSSCKDWLYKTVKVKCRAVGYNENYKRM